MLRIAATVTSLSLAISAQTAFGTDAVTSAVLPLDYVAHRLSASGHDLRSIRAERGAYVADVVERDRRICTVTLRPENKQIRIDPVEPTACTADPAPAKSLSASTVIQLAAAAGYPEIASIGFRDGTYRAQATDTDGDPVLLTIAPMDGRILSAQRQERH
jgi:hypothetical protein